MMMIEVGIPFGVVPVPVGVNSKLFVRLIVKPVVLAPVVGSAVYGTVSRTGDQTVRLVVFAVAVAAAGFRALQLGAGARAVAAAAP
jgi:hypothetical protein